ncbi:hypothetical protein MRX96_040825 [Rhipicephalus microplus]
MHWSKPSSALRGRLCLLFRPEGAPAGSFNLPDSCRWRLHCRGQLQIPDPAAACFPTERGVRTRFSAAATRASSGGQVVAHGRCCYTCHRGCRFSKQWIAWPIPRRSRLALLTETALEMRHKNRRRQNERCLSRL